MIVTASHLVYTYEDSFATALDDVSLTLANGWTGIVGSNGAGKSTLLKLLCGLIKPASGSISPRASGTYCAQPTEYAPENLEEFACDYAARAYQLRALLDIDDAWLWRYDTLSHGERKRVQIACALAQEPAMLALDEPTNHLDATTRDAVLKALATYQGIGLLVSHDRALLDSLVQQCLFLDAGSADLVPGTYTEAKAQIDLRAKTTQSARKRAREEVSRLQSEASRRKAEAGRTASRRSARNLDRHDSDGRARIGLAIVSGQDGKTGLLSAQMDKKLENAQKRLDEAKVRKTYDKPLDLMTERAKRSVVARLNEGTMSLGEGRCLHYPTLLVGPADRIGLEGPNGAGKSTLLEALLSDITPNEGILYIPQEIGAEQGRHLLALAKALPSQERGRMLSIVARLNSPPERILAGEDLSPGELRKLMLAEGLLRRPYIIAMDEPTNHLDLHSIEALQAVLASCDCTLLLVSHDRPFMDALTNVRWTFEPSQESQTDPSVSTGNTRVSVRYA